MAGLTPMSFLRAGLSKYCLVGKHLKFAFLLKSVDANIGVELLACRHLQDRHWNACIQVWSPPLPRFQNNYRFKIYHRLHDIDRFHRYHKTRLFRLSNKLKNNGKMRNTLQKSVIHGKHVLRKVVKNTLNGLPYRKLLKKNCEQL